MKLEMDDLWKMACAHSALMDGTIGPIVKILDSADVVFGVFPKTGEPSVFNWHVIKGLPLLASVASGTKSRAAKVTAIMVNDREMAIAASSVLGDGRDERVIIFDEGQE